MKKKRNFYRWTWSVRRSSKQFLSRRVATVVTLSRTHWSNHSDWRNTENSVVNIDLNWSRATRSDNSMTNTKTETKSNRNKTGRPNALTNGSERFYPRDSARRTRGFSRRIPPRGSCIRPIGRGRRTSNRGSPSDKSADLSNAERRRFRAEESVGKRDRRGWKSCPMRSLKRINKRWCEDIVLFTVELPRCLGRCPVRLRLPCWARCEPFELLLLANIFRICGRINPLRCNSTILCLNKFDCRPIREPSMDIPAFKHFRKRHARQEFRALPLITQLLFSAHLKRGGTLSRNVRRKNPLQPWRKSSTMRRRRRRRTVELTSQVVVPKWIPDDGSWQMTHGICWKMSSILGFGLFSNWKIERSIDETKRRRKKLYLRFSCQLGGIWHSDSIDIAFGLFEW